MFYFFKKVLLGKKKDFAMQMFLRISQNLEAETGGVL